MTSTSTPTPIPPAPESDFARALGFAGLPVEENSTPAAPASTPPAPEIPPTPDHFFTPPEPEPEEPEVKIPTPSELLRIIKAVDWIVMRGVAGAKYPGIPPEILGPAIKLQPEDEAVLEELAPYAVEYLPEIAKYLKPVMACAFVGVWGLSVVTRTKILAQIHEELRVRKARTVKAETVS